MKINTDNTKKRLEGVPDNERVFIYDAGIIMRFLRETFMPTESYLEGYEPKSAASIDLQSFNDKGKENAMSIRDLYDIYLLWRERQTYSRDTESPYIFSLIVKRLRYYRNGWEFHIFRRGAAQIWYAGPLVYRKDVTPGERERYAIPKGAPTIAESEVPAPVIGMDPGAPEGDRTVVISPRLYDTYPEPIFTPKASDPADGMIRKGSDQLGRTVIYNRFKEAKGPWKEALAEWRETM